MLEYYYILDEDGNVYPAVTEEEAVRSFLGDRTIALTEIGSTFVSTVSLGIDQSYGELPEPIVFETMVFGGELDSTKRLYTSLEAARRGHDEIVAQVRAIEGIAEED